MAPGFKDFCIHVLRLQVNINMADGNVSDSGHRIKFLFSKMSLKYGLFFFYSFDFLTNHHQEWSQKPYDHKELTFTKLSVESQPGVSFHYLLFQGCYHSFG